MTMMATPASSKAMLIFSMTWTAFIEVRGAETPGFRYGEEAPPLLSSCSFTHDVLPCEYETATRLSLSLLPDARASCCAGPDVRLGARSVYDWALRLRTDAYYQRTERLSYAATSAALTLLKREPETTWLNDVSSVPPQQALRHLDRAFRNFFAGRAKYPAFHKKHGKQSAEYTTSAFRWDAQSQTLTLAKMDAPLDIRWSRPLPEGAMPSTVTVSRDTAGRSFVSLLVEEESAALPPAARSIGIDVGLHAVVVLDSGDKVGNPRFFHQEEQRLAKAQKRLAKK